MLSLSDVNKNKKKKRKENIENNNNTQYSRQMFNGVTHVIYEQNTSDII